MCGSNKIELAVLINFYWSLIDEMTLNWTPIYEFITRCKIFSRKSKKEKSTWKFKKELTITWNSVHEKQPKL